MGGAVRQIVAANIDTVLLCDSLDGRLGLRHLERFLALAWQSGATPVVLMTKSDRVTAEFVAEARQAIKTVAAGVSVLVISSTTGEGIANLADYLVEGRTVALLGLSGAGKSTLANLLAKADLLATSAVRSDGHGRHTTTHRQLVRLPGGGLLIDTPGMRALSVVGAGEGVPQAFRDLEALALGCMYDNCSHQGEQGCEVAVAVSAGQLTARPVGQLAPIAGRASGCRSGVGSKRGQRSASDARRPRSPIAERPNNRLGPGSYWLIWSAGTVPLEPGLAASPLRIPARSASRTAMDWLTRPETVWL